MKKVGPIGKTFESVNIIWLWFQGEIYQNLEKQNLQKHEYWWKMYNVIKKNIVSDCNNTVYSAIGMKPRDMLPDT